MGWATCSKGGYYVTGLYRNMHHQLKDIDRLRCCSMIEDHGTAARHWESAVFAGVCAVKLIVSSAGSNEDLVQSLPSSAITASSCFADYTSEGMHSILGKQYAHARAYLTSLETRCRAVLVTRRVLITGCKSQGPVSCLAARREAETTGNALVLQVYITGTFLALLEVYSSRGLRVRRTRDWKVFARRRDLCR